MFRRTLCGAALVLLSHAADGAEPKARRYWAYRPVARPAVPSTADQSWVRNPIDAFVLSKLDAAKVPPVRPAGKVALIRRAYYDLTGLPPTPQEIDAFVKDDSPGAYERLIDTLLASKHYGEKWGRHWLDLVRYAETNGYERDGPKPYVWRYRDYVIRSFNADKPFDRFIKEQLAGDEIAPDDADAVIATGYYRLGLWDDEAADLKQARYDELDDLVATTGQVFLGMTLNCARCHGHKGDPIPQRDYYRMVAFFQDVPRYSKTRSVRSPYNLTDISPPDQRAKYQAEFERRQEKIAEVEKQMVVIEEKGIDRMPAKDQRAAEGPRRRRVLRELRKFLEPDDWREYKKLRGQVNLLKRMPEPLRTVALSVNNCQVPPPVTHVMARGNPHAPGEAVEPGFPEAVASPDPAEVPPVKPGAKKAGRRTVLANWIASGDNPLTARVLANRLWQYHFGRGIVPTPNDFGKLGESPTHPELLDWLAAELVKGGWKLKRMHKLIMLSSAYRMASSAHERGLAADPGNKMFWRFPMRRLTAEEVRDSILEVVGRLNREQFGPSVYPKLPKAVLAGQSRPGEGWHTSPPEKANRRSVYVHVKRSLLVPILSRHDSADTDSSCPVRYVTTVPTQSLGMLNGDFINEQAVAFAERLRREQPGDLGKQVRRAIRLTCGRPATDAEVKADLAFIADLRKSETLGEFDALRYYCLVTLNANEFIYLD